MIEVNITSVVADQKRLTITLDSGVGFEYQLGPQGVAGLLAERLASAHETLALLAVMRGPQCTRLVLDPTAAVPLEVNG